MDSIIEVPEDVVSDPLKHLLSLDWNSSVTATAIENNFEPTKSVKRVRFSDEVEKISYDSDVEKNIDITFSHEEGSDDKNNNIEIHDDLSDENRTDVFTESTEFTNFELPFNDGENIVESVINDIDDNSLVNSSTEIDIITPEVEDSVNKNIDQNDFLLVDNYEDNEMKSFVNLEEQANDLNEVTNQVKNLSLENASLENRTSLSLVMPVSEPSDLNMHNIENSKDEMKSITSDDSSISLNRRVKSKLYNRKQSWKLNSVLTENSCYSSASELNSAVFKAWCEVKNKTKSVETAVSNEKNVSNRQTTTNSAYSTWKKSKIEAQKKAKRDKSNFSQNFPNMHRENTKNSKEEIEMAFKAWKKKKDETLKQKMAEKLDKEQEQVVESLMEKKEKKMEAEAAFNAWKQHKSHLIKMEKKKRSWVMQKRKEEEEKKLTRDREALIVYHMWLESKISVKHSTFSPVKTKPPWTPPGK
ncbi:microtubule-associated protein 9-like isoform X2 [Argiope bruennichi]|nr:microtubule-associated protein 9-like isoform X2 [Argiope bruennichi]XP_055927933.1 microtubule-associated protein 9-like isoform X2 [Argiope bruennichi]